MANERTAVITGAASGIGLATARALAADGVGLVLLDRSESVKDVANSVGVVKVHTIIADLGDLDQVLQAADEVNKKFGGCDILVNNAGVHPKRDGKFISFEEMTVEDWETVFRINTTAPFLLCQKLVAGMKERRWGRIVNIASRAGRTFSNRAGTHYSASKAALIGMTRSVAGAYASFGITANCVAPGQIETPLAQTSDPEVLKRAANSTPAGRLGTADEVASAVRYLTTDGAGFVTGTVIDVNGGDFIG
ncbi:SDR family oxidoreductase [Burkholderia pseudomallei]|nr:SDR family oxidoreductase [Burkholderia pseudomallei]